MAQYDDYVGQLETRKRVSPDGAEYWHARELMEVLDYDRWENFSGVIIKAMEACGSAGVPVENHFRETTKMITIGKGGERAAEDWFLSRYACYLVAMNAESSKEAVGYAQTYFAIKDEEANLVWLA